LQDTVEAREETRLNVCNEEEIVHDMKCFAVKDDNIQDTKIMQLGI